MTRTGRRLLAVLALGLCAGLTACSGSDGCAGESYHPDLGSPGATTPIDALGTWLGTHGGFTTAPPDDGWVVQDTGEKDPDIVTITNDAGDGWWVSTVRTDDGGYVVSQATDAADGCADLP